MSQETTLKSIIGSTLRESREAQKLTIEEVSAQLRLSEKQITALEQEDFESFGSAMLTRGFIKNYARLLSLDHEPLLEAHRSMAPEDQAQSIAYISQSVSNPADVRMSKPKLLILGAFIFVCLFAWLIYHNLSSPQSAESVEIKLESKDQASMPVPALPFAERTEVTSPNATITTDAKLPEDSSSVDKEKKQIKLEDSNSEQSKSESVQSEVKIGEDKVTFKFTEDSWINVQDKNYKTILSKLGRKGSVEEVEGLTPLRIVIGNANGTQITFKYKVLDLSTYNKNNVVHINLPME